MRELTLTEFTSVSGGWSLSDDDTPPSDDPPYDNPPERDWERQMREMEERIEELENQRDRDQRLDEYVRGCSSVFGAFGGAIGVAVGTGGGPPGMVGGGATGVSIGTGLGVAVCSNDGNAREIRGESES